MQKDLKLQDYLEIFWRRKWCLILLFVVGTSLAVVYSYLLPPIYRSSTLILVEAQKIPTSYVSSTLTFTMQERLNTLKQQITSRTNLEIVWHLHLSGDCPSRAKRRNSSCSGDRRSRSLAASIVSRKLSTFLCDLNKIGAPNPAHVWP